MTLTFWYTRCPVPTALSIALQTGALAAEFADDRIDIRSLASSTDAKVRQAHFEATAPNFFRHGGNGPPLVSRARGADLRVLGLSWNASYRPLLALPQSGIRSVANLKGRRLSIPRRRKDSVDFWYATALRGIAHALHSGGLTVNDVELVEVATDRTFIGDSRAQAKPGDSLWDARYMLGHQREEAFALVRGEIDALYSQGAMAAILESSLGATTVVDNGGVTPPYASNNDAPLVLSASGTLIDEHPDLVARWVARVSDAADWARKNELAAKTIIASETGLAVELVDRAFSPRVHEELGVDLAADKVAALRSHHDHLVAIGQLAERLDFDTFVDPRPLALAREIRASRLERDAA